MYQTLVSHIIKHYAEFYKKNKRIISAVNNPHNIIKGGRRPRIHTRKMWRRGKKTIRYKKKSKKTKRVNLKKRNRKTMRV